MKFSVNSPKTPVTKGSSGVAVATLPNICKMPGPPAPFVPTPLPNIGRSSIDPKGYSKKVTVEAKPVAIRGASFGSQGDAASKGTGGGIVSANTHGPTRFVSPGSMDVKIEGKNVHLLGDMMLNNCGPSGAPANSATMAGVVQQPKTAADDCTHEKVKQDPAEDTLGYHDQERPGDGGQRQMASKIAKQEKKLARVRKAQRRASSPRKAKQIDRDIAGLESNMVGDRWELAVAEQVEPERMGVKLICESCGLILGEFDLVLDNGVVKECKASWGAMTPKKFSAQIELVETRGLLGPGRVMHYAIPKAARDGKQLATKFGAANKAQMSGRVQEH